MWNADPGYPKRQGSLLNGAVKCINPYNVCLATTDFLLLFRKWLAGVSDPVPTRCVDLDDLPGNVAKTTVRMVADHNQITIPNGIIVIL